MRRRHPFRVSPDLGRFSVPNRETSMLARCLDGRELFAVSLCMGFPVGFITNVPDQIYASHNTISSPGIHCSRLTSDLDQQLEQCVWRHGTAVADL